MTSSRMPVFSARVALCRQWPVHEKRYLKKSRSVGSSGIDDLAFLESALQVVLERIGFLVRGHERDCARPTEARHESSSIDFYHGPPTLTANDASRSG